MSEPYTDENGREWRPLSGQEHAEFFKRHDGMYRDIGWQKDRAVLRADIYRRALIEVLAARTRESVRDALDALIREEPR